MTKLRCVTVVKDKSICVGCRVKCTPANDEFPELISEVEDDCEQFIVDPKSRVFWQARDFFVIHSITTFEVDAKEMQPGAPIDRRR